MSESVGEYETERQKAVGGLTNISFPDSSTFRVPSRLKMLSSDAVAILLAICGAGMVSALIGAQAPANFAQLWGVIKGSLGNYIFFVPMLIGLFMYGGLYNRTHWEGDEIGRILTGTAFLGAGDAVLVATGAPHNTSAWMLLVWPFAAILVTVLRMVMRTVPLGFAGDFKHVLIVGSGIAPEKFKWEMRESRSRPVNRVSTLPMRALADFEALALPNKIGAVSESFGVDPDQIRLVLAPSVDELAQAERVASMMNAARRPFSIVLPFPDLAQRGTSLHRAVGADFVLADVQDETSDPAERAVKTGLDFSLAAAGVIVLAPLFLLIALLLKLESPGPVFFSQVRLGKNGRRFNCLKFRSMCVDAERRLSDLLAADPEAKKEWKAHQKLRKDPRITRMGTFLRATSLDEIPQLFNVLAGHMSIVGPRPIVAPEIPGYKSDREYFESPEFAHYARCRPGITGLWQVSGRARTTHEERVRLDGWYCRNWSIWLDLMIMLKTVRAVLVRTGS